MLSNSSISFETAFKQLRMNLRGDLFEAVNDSGPGPQYKIVVDVVHTV